MLLMGTTTHASYEGGGPNGRRGAGQAEPQHAKMQAGFHYAWHLAG